ncbi:O-linked acetylglucosamine transferase [Limnohabitans sp. MORI2]|uniref:O-linked N-acetylglucosamine transferase, SPINDLY family protein n=1 Tax=Limnohabitans sp. MORI2 TaxID=1751150 RepID=UPI002376D281|nr:tetratricopeptide repeat protein [Limnohabitans sp. MORI2]BDU57535.1 O-linked acetylglucosamine transferase [Limnohabitans sp. MORI2]
MDLEEISQLGLDQVIQLAEHFQTTGRTADAIALYGLWNQHSESNDRHIGWFNQGVMQLNAGDIEGAEQAYRESLNLFPGFAQARINLGLLLERKGQHDDAMLQWSQVAASGYLQGSANLDLQALALNHIGRLQEQLKHYDLAENALTQSLQLKARQADALQHWVHLRSKQCKWPAMQALPGVPVNLMLTHTSPLAMLALHDDPALQLMAAQAFVQRKFNLPTHRLCVHAPYAHERIRIGYLSGDLCTHAVGLLMAELLEAHDRDRFEVYAFDYSPEDGSEYRQRLKQAFDHVVDIRALDDTQAAAEIAFAEIDVLIDLHGLSSGARPGILAMQPAPLQGTYLGFIGTTTLPWLQFVVTDRFTFPESLIPFFSEKPLYVEGSFLPLHHTPTAECRETRSDLGLPQDAFVMVCFNNVYKFNPQMFATWMNILKRVDDAVLWLLDDNPSATRELKKHIAAHGIELERVVFTQRTSHVQYRTRMQLADVFLDTTPYNSGSTARDVIDSGLPMVTLSGRTCVSRMAGSLLHAAGLDDLITYSHADYENLVVDLAHDRTRLASYRQQLLQGVAARLDAPKKLVKSLEAQLLQMVKTL